MVSCLSFNLHFNVSCYISTMSNEKLLLFKTILKQFIESTGALSVFFLFPFVHKHLSERCAHTLTSGSSGAVEVQMPNKTAVGPSFIEHLWKKKMALLHTVHTLFGMIKQRMSKIRLHLLNHEYSNMNIPYINEICLLYYCAKQHIHIY